MMGVEIGLLAFAATTVSLCEYDIMAWEEAGRGRRALVEKDRLWEGGRVPYMYTHDVSEGLRAKTESVMRRLEGMAAVSFVPAGKMPRGGILVVSTRHVENPHGCWATVGSPGREGVAKMNLGWCRQERHITHELLHVLGMWHEQSRADSGNFLNLDRSSVNDCIIRGTDSRGFAYDFRSIMHYPLETLGAELTAAGIERLRRQNIRADQVGFWGEASPGDVKQLADLYGRGTGVITRDKENSTAAAGIIVAAVVVAILGLYWGMTKM